MTKNLRNEPNVLIAFGAAGLLATLAASGCNGNSSADSNGGGSGTSGASATSNGGSSGGKGASGGTAGDSSGATGGSAGTDATGGAAGESGGESSGGSSGAMGGKGGTGGAGRGGAGAGPGGSGGGPAGSGGAGGSGGSGGGAAGMTGTLGTPCTPRGALACAGNHQKLTVLCGGDDTWQPNQTCGDGQFCDSTPGPNVGTCRPELPECADGPGTKWCAADEKTLVTCGPDLVSTLTQSCDGACHNDECRDVSDCPMWDDHDVGVACSLDCGAGNRTCSRDSIGCTVFSFALAQGGSAVVRTPWADGTCADCAGTAAGAGGYMRISVGGTADYVRVTVAEPWHVASYEMTLCTQASQCIVTSTASFFTLISTGLEAGPANVLIEDVDSTATCPPM